MAGGGHAPSMREPVLTNLLVRRFAETAMPVHRPPRVWTRARNRRRRALFVSSPIGLGHVRRDLAIADELRALRPDLEIDWLTQHPVTRVLDERGEHVHPASSLLAGETAHLESEAGEHDLNVFRSVRRMDEILVANFMVFADLVEDDPYDLWIADEGWDVDAFLHDNPELKRAPFAWLTDFTGWLPSADGGAEEAALTADWNAERIERGVGTRGCGTGRCSWGSRPTSSTSRSAPACRRPASGPASAMPSPATPWVSRSPDRDEARAPCSATDRRAGLPGHRRRLRGRDGAAAPHGRRVPAGREAGAGAPDGAGHRATDRPGLAVACRRASRCTATCPTCGGTSPRATSPSSRAACRRRWS